jgi:hypothetical protein
VLAFVWHHHQQATQSPDRRRLCGRLTLQGLQDILFKKKKKLPLFGITIDGPRKVETGGAYVGA